MPSKLQRRAKWPRKHRVCYNVAVSTNKQQSRLGSEYLRKVSMLVVVVDGTEGTGVILLTTAKGLEHCEEAEESQSKLRSMVWTGEGLFCDTVAIPLGSPPFLMRASSWAWARLRAVCMAITLCLSDVSLHFSHLQLRYLQYRLWPFRAIFILWFLQRAQFGGVRGDDDVLDALLPLISIFGSNSWLSDMFSTIRLNCVHFLYYLRHFHLKSCCTVRTADHVRGLPATLSF